MNSSRQISHLQRSQFPARLKELLETDGHFVGRPFLISLFEHQEFF